MSQHLAVIALISGGKDSLYSLLHCIQNGHKIVALANLCPETPEAASATSNSNGDVASEEAEDINSFMYQTVGHSIVPLYSSALDLPLYRRQITGTAVQTGRYYAHTPDQGADETEDLIPLLKKVMRYHPEANAICSGAILSTYQRTRIESVAIRLGIVSLSYLWQYPALPPPVEREDSLTGLLDDMAAAGCDARIIKIASGGIKQSLHWANITRAGTRQEIVASMSPFFGDHEFWLRGAVLGEGGEYETLATNGPRKLWKKRIVVEHEGNVVTEGEGGVSYLNFGVARTMDQEVHEESPTNDSVRVPVLLDPTFADLQAQICKNVPSPTPTGQTQISKISRTMIQAVPHRAPSLSASVRLSSTAITISNITAPESQKSAVQQIENIIQILNAVLDSLRLDHPLSSPLTADEIVFTTLILRSMSDFAIINAEYGKLFRKPNPPARVTVACGDALPDDVLVSLSVILARSPREKWRGLHVQSRSYWAPANIGPYSQAICVPIDGDAAGGDGNDGEVVYVAGQIPLVPHTMELLEGTFLEQAVLSLQHLWRVGQERGVDWWTHGIAFLAKLDDERAEVEQDGARLSWEIWKRAHSPSRANVDHDEDDEDEDEDDESAPDAWDLKHNPYHHHSLHLSQPRKPSGNHLHPLPNFASLTPTKEKPPPSTPVPVPPLLIAQVSSLPRSAPIEWHSLGLAKRPLSPRSITLSATATSWGVVSRCVAAHQRSSQNQQSGSDTDDDDDAAAAAAAAASSQSRKSRVGENPAVAQQFITIQIYDSHEPPPSISALRLPSLNTIILQEDLGEAGWEMTQATAYVSTSSSPSGWQILETLRGSAGSQSQSQLSWDDGVAVIPCWSLWGATTDVAVSAAGSASGAGAGAGAGLGGHRDRDRDRDLDHEREGEGEGKGREMGGARKLSLGIVMRVERAAARAVVATST